MLSNLLSSPKLVVGIALAGAVWLATQQGCEFQQRRDSQRTVRLRRG